MTVNWKPDIITAGATVHHRQIRKAEEEHRTDPAHVRQSMRQAILGMKRVKVFSNVRTLPSCPLLRQYVPNFSKEIPVPALPIYSFHQFTLLPVIAVFSGRLFPRLSVGTSALVVHVFPLLPLPYASYLILPVFSFLPTVSTTGSFNTRFCSSILNDLG
jgi:hypothetical protein